MNAPAQMMMFEPDAAACSQLLQGWLRDAERAAALADKWELLRMPGAVRIAEAQMADAVASAIALAIYLDLLAVAGEAA